MLPLLTDESGSFHNCSSFPFQDCLPIFLHHITLLQVPLSEPSEREDLMILRSLAFLNLLCKIARHEYVHRYRYCPE